MLIKPFPEFQNIHAIAIPLPDVSDLITANVYAVGNGPITLIDTGLKSPGTLEYIQNGLARADLSIEHIERIIITHGHMDHFGLAASIRETAGHPVECFIHSEDQRQISSENFLKEMWSEEADSLTAMAGMPREEVEKVRERFSTFKELGDPLDGISLMKDGDEFMGDGYHLKVIHTPGHTPGSCCVYESRQKILFSGDHIIKHITPNPLVVIKRDRLNDPEYQSLKAYIDSLDKLSDLDVRYVFPGHGEYIEDLQRIIATYEAHHQERMELVWKALKKKTRPLYEIIDDVFPFVPEGDVFLAISEIIVHLEILVEEGRAKLVDPGPPALYRAL
ncbi:MAG: MBL fold metallo-hydrolase [Desulfobacteraceae bacterium]|jgi:glyoxylase-like metal-dependent hydrolase (beta-lactamase superfamily II)